MIEQKLRRELFPETPEIVHNAVLNALDHLESPAARRFAPRRKALSLPLAALLCICLLSATALAVGAALTYRQRMESMSAAQLESCYSIAMNGETLGFSRALTAEESALLDALTIQYENGRFPESSLPELDGAAYDGETVALDAEKRLVCLPEAPLSEEELLQIIDFNHKSAYSIYQKSKSTEESGWMARMAALSDAELDRIYLAALSGDSEISGAYSRPLTEEESARYDALTAAYEAGSALPAAELPIVASPEEYAGDGAALCTSSSVYLLPEETLTDDALLQLIDFEHKARYALSEINSQIDLGLRAGYPARQG